MKLTKKMDKNCFFLKSTSYYYLGNLYFLENFTQYIINTYIPITFGLFDLREFFIASSFVRDLSSISRA